MPLQRISFGRHSYNSDTRPLSTQQLINMYLENNPEDAKSPTIVRSVPGLTTFVQSGTGPVRGMLVDGDFLFLVSGDRFFRVDSSGVPSLIGTVAGTNPVRMASNGFQIAVVADTKSYKVSDILASLPASVSVVEIVDPQFRDSIDVVYQDGFHIFVAKDSQEFFISDISASSGGTGLDAFNATEFTRVVSSEDLLIGIASLNRELWAFGERTIEIYYNSGDAVFPFSRSTAGTINRGCISRDSIATYENTIFWLGDDFRVYANRGYSGVPISNQSIDRQIDNFSSPESSIGSIYSKEGHVFYSLKFDETTFVFDVSTGLWHERKSYLRDTFRGQFTALFGQRTLVGDDTTGSVFELDSDVFTERNDPLIRTAVSPPLHGEGRRISMNELWIDVETGVGLVTGQGASPTLLLDWSDDGGRTYTSVRNLDMGVLGSYRTRVRTHRMGQFRDRTIRVSVSDPVAFNIIDSYADISLGVD